MVKLPHGPGSAQCLLKDNEMDRAWELLQLISYKSGCTPSMSSSAGCTQLWDAPQLPGCSVAITGLQTPGESLHLDPCIYRDMYRPDIKANHIFLQILLGVLQLMGEKKCFHFNWVTNVIFQNIFAPLLWCSLSRLNLGPFLKVVKKWKLEPNKTLFFLTLFDGEKKLGNVNICFSSFSLYLPLIKEASVWSSSLILWFWSF